ncbi:hypothetical protein [Sporomusa termitida]|uniref:Uncharacterized protein n=1 Tax=Sporomusa termitida TaxID=2377 RepID=A0A517DUR9_9FIRM|nr:hypothetical protein [Sporomusa termitida]QDR81048.1 hypothetical protein SPTER_24030 [Sporomusa termitida]
MKGFKRKNGKFASLVSLIALTAMLMLFAVNLPVFLGSTAGKVFIAFWGGFALVMGAAHVVRLAAPRERRLAIVPLTPGLKDARTRKKQRSVRGLQS